jgi:hypothetical protein
MNENFDHGLAGPSWNRRETNLFPANGELTHLDMFTTIEVIPLQYHVIERKVFMTFLGKCKGADYRAHPQDVVSCVQEVSVIPAKVAKFLEIERFVLVRVPQA